jgi:hypothetical protein
MVTTLADSTATRREATLARDRRMVPYLRLSFIATWRYRETRRRMLHAVRELDHPGVLADVQLACGPLHR